MPCSESSCFSVKSDTLYDHFYVIFLKKIKLQFIMISNSVACFQVISNVSLNI